MKDKKLIIDHFKGVNDAIPRGRQYPGYSRRVSGVIDRPGGNLARLYGMISATTGPCPSIWSIAQLRFRDRWDLLLQNGSRRELYEQDLMPWGPWPTPPPVVDPDPIITYPEPVMEHPEDDENHDPRLQPSVCHSWWDIKFGRWHVLDIADITFYFSTRGTYGSWLAPAGGPGSCASVVQAALQNVIDDTPAGWGNWSVICPPLWAPHVASHVLLQSWGWGANPPQAMGQYQELRWTVRSATLAAADPYAYSGVIIRCGTMVMNLPGGLGSLIGGAWWGQAPIMVGGLDTNRSPGMIFYDVGRSSLCSDILSGGAYNCPGAPPAFTNDFHLSTGSCTPDEAYFYQYGGRITTHDTCFEEK